MCGNPPPYKEKSSQAVPPAGHPAALCGEQHSYYIDFHFPGQVKLIENLLFISFFDLLNIESQNFFSQDIGGIPLIHISTLLLSIYPHFVEMLWITPFFWHFYPQMSLLCLFCPPYVIVDYLLKIMLSTILSTFIFNLTNLNNFYIYIKILINLRWGFILL